MFSLLTFKSRVLGFAALGVIGIAAALPFALSDDGPWVSVSFEQSSYAVAEGDSVTVTVKLDVVPDREVVVPITTTEEGGASGPDYSGVPASLTFASWETEKTFSFTAAQDTIDDDGESVSLALGSLPTGVNEGDTGETDVFINDDDGVGIVVSETALTIGEGGSTTYTVVLASQPTADVKVTLVTTGGSGVSVNANRLTFTASNWGDEQTVTVSAAQDDDHLDETAAIGHAVTSDDGDYDGIRMASVGVSVIDDEEVPVTVTFDQAAHPVAEGSAVTVTVTLSADPERRVVIPLTKSEQGGITGADYSGVPETLTFEDGETVKTFTVTAVQDTVDDDDESVTMGFGSLPNAVTTGATSETTVSIADDDVPSVTVSFESAVYAVAEGGEIEVTITLSADPERQVVVPLTKSEQNGASSEDYSGVPSDVTFASGETEQSFTFTATQDRIDDDGENAGESVKLAFGASLPTRVGEGATSETTLTIIDDDGTGITVSPTTLNMAEGLSKAYTVVLASQPAANVTVSVTAPDNSDVTVDRRALTFTTSNWEAVQTVTVSASHDFDGSDETVTITHAVTAAASDYSGKAVASVTVNVIDNDDVRVKANFERESYRVTEGSTITIKVTLDKDPERRVVIPIEAIEQDGMTSDDYSGVPSSVTFERGETEKAFTFAAAQDQADDDEESVKLDFGSLPTAVTGGRTDETTVTITDDDPTFIERAEETLADPDVAVKVGFEQAGYTVVEGNAVVVTLTLSRDPQRQVVVPISATEEGGLTSTDYSGVPSSVTFESGEASSSFTFTAVQDVLDEEDESLRLDLGALPNAVTAGTIKAATISVINDGPEPIREVTVSFEQATYAVEEGSRVSVKVMLDRDPGRQVVIPIIQTRYNGITPSDYSGIPSQVVFESGEQEKTFDFSATEDMLDDDEEAVALGFPPTLPDAVKMGPMGETMVNIRDNDGVGVRISPGRLTIDEGEEDTYTVVLNAQPTADVVVTVGTPTNPDVSIDETTLTFTDSTWHDPQTVTVSTDHDEDYLDDTATISHTVTSTAADYNGIRVRSLSVKVDDDEVVPVTVNFKSATYSVNEGASVRVTVTLDKDPEREVVVPITKTEQGDASSDDYSGVPENVTFRNGQTERTFTFSAYQDKLDDDGESVALGFDTSQLDEVSEGTTATATVSINDDDGAGVRVSPTTLTINEGRSQNYTVVLNSQPTHDVTIAISKTGSSDVSTNKQTLTFTGSNWYARQTVRVTAAADDDDHLDESATITHTATSTDSGYNGISVGSVEVDVIDDEDVPVTVSFGQAAYFVDEGDQVTVEVTLSEDPQRRVVIPINRMEQDGATSSDYSGVPRNVIFASGQTERTITFTARQDTVDDDDESVKLGFGTLPNAVTEGTPNEATIDINDDDNPILQVNFGQAAYSVDEGSTVTVTVKLSADPEREVEIPITKSDQGGVSTPEDYSGVPETLTFVSGDTEESFTFTAASDTIDDDGESVRLNFGSDLPSRISGGTIARTTVSINDDDGAGVTITPNARTIDEGGEDTYTVVLTSEPTADVTVTVNVPNGSELSVDETTLTFTDTTWNQEQTVTITAGQDDDHLDDDGTITHSVSSTDTDYNSFAAGSVKVTTIDDEDVPVTVSFESAAYSVSEGSTVSVKVRLSEDPERQVVIPVTASEQGNADTSDYSGAPTDLTFESGETEQTITFMAEQDDVDDDNESVLLRFDSDNLPDSVTEGTTNRATVSIDDDDDPSIEVSFELASYSVNEGSTVSVKVKLSADPERQVIIPITTNDQDGASSNDYTAMPDNVTFQTGETEVLLDFIATDDSLNDDGESVKLSFGSQLPDRVDAVSPDETTISINDDDGPSVKVSQTSLTITEGSSNTYTVVLTSQPTADVTVTVTADTNPDVTVDKTTLTFTDSDWNRRQTVRVSAAHDDDALAETATITHSAASTDTDYSGISVGGVNVSVTDDETEVYFSSDIYMATEGGEDATVVVHLSQPAPSRMVIRITAEGKAGATSGDWSGAPTTLTFNVGDERKSFTVVAVDDDVEDNGEQVELGFSTPLPSGVIPGDPDTAIVTLTNAECDNLATKLILLDDTGTISQAGEKDLWTFDFDPRRHYIIEVIGADDGRDILDEDTHPGDLTLADPELISVRKVDGTEGAEYSEHISDAGYGRNSQGGWVWYGSGPWQIEVGGSGGTGTYQIKIRVNTICMMLDGEKRYPYFGGPNGYAEELDEAADTTTKHTVRPARGLSREAFGSGGFLGDIWSDEPDEDWFKATLTQGVEYTIDLWSADDEPTKHQATDLKILGIYDSTGTVIANTASSGSGAHVSVVFEPDSTGVYYIAVGSGASDRTGMYILRVGYEP